MLLKICFLFFFEVIFDFFLVVFGLLLFYVLIFFVGSEGFRSVILNLVELLVGLVIRVSGDVMLVWLEGVLSIVSVLV